MPRGPAVACRKKLGGSIHQDSTAESAALRLAIVGCAAWKWGNCELLASLTNLRVARNYGHWGVGTGAGGGELGGRRNLGGRGCGVGGWGGGGGGFRGGGGGGGGGGGRWRLRP